MFLKESERYVRIKDVADTESGCAGTVGHFILLKIKRWFLWG